jgi:MYXO-CTERM domain-containing protein
MKRVITTLGMCLLGLSVASVSRVAHACGGTFCDSGPSALPVNQTGENVLFVLDGNTVEAHIQIQYMGGATRFAWIVPMPKVPDVSVGSQLLFNALLQGTVPSYGFTNQFDQCGNGTGSSVGSPTLNASGGASAGGASSVGGGPTVVFQKVVGSFEVAVLQGGTAQEVTDWLNSNGYQTVPNAPMLLQKYVDKSYVFAAIKLTTTADVNEIHPLVFKYPGNEPCVPLQLTAVAAQPDMGVRTFFLGDDRVFPSNYAHVVLNPVRVDWQNLGSNYNSAVSRAVDSKGSDGHGFITEYAGASAVVSGAGLYNSLWSAAAFRGALPQQVMELLTQQGLAQCQMFGGPIGEGGAESSTEGNCSFNQPLVLPLLEQYLPLPAGGDPNAYACLSCTGTTCLGCGGVAIDATAWDGNAFADDLQARVIDPGQHAQELLSKWPYLTRLFTTISPEEMTLDPTFEARPELSEQFVSMTSDLAVRRTTCCGQAGMILPAQGSSPARQVALNGSAWPPFSSLMPWAEKIEQVPLLGDVTTVADNSQAIDAELEKWNVSQGWPPSATCSGAVGASGNGSTQQTSSSGGFGAGGSAGSNGLKPGGAGCNCSVPRPASASGLAGLVALLGLGLFRRRRALSK